MTDIITNRLKVFSIDNILSTIELPDGTNNLYAFIGKSTPWSTTSDTPPTPTDTILCENSHWSTMIALKRLTAADNARFCARLSTWTTNTVYSSYDEASETANPHYVMADNTSFNVYKCIDNNDGAESTVKPTGYLTTTFQTSDGYTWKYMYSVEESDQINFLSENWLPVQTLTEDDFGAHGVQWDVQQAAVAGIEFTKLTSNGSGYNNTLIVNPSINSLPSSTIVLTIGSATTDNIYVGASVYLHQTDGDSRFSQSRLITSYTASTRIATLASAFGSNTEYSGNAWQYSVLPTVELNGDGSGAVIQPSVTGGVISGLTIFSGGTGYHVTNPSITGCGGTGASLTVKISPPGGHGSDAVKELYAHNLMFSVYFKASETGFPQVNDYRKIGLIKNVCASGTTAVANSSFTTFTAYSSMTTSTPSSTYFSQDEVFTQTTVSATTGIKAKGIVIEHKSDNTLKYYQDESTGFTPFMAGATIISDSVNVATITSLTGPTVSRFSGQVLYVEQRTPVTRNGINNELFKIVIKF